MVLVDTSVWIAHLRSGVAHLGTLLEAGQVVCHLFVVGELACGKLVKRAEILTLLQTLPTAEVATDTEVLQFIEAHRLMEVGLGCVDVHLLASASLTHVSLLTLDRRLHAAASRLGVASRG
ncbi:MAG: PIN domain-containing protein [Sedimentisphaerales bacterium]|nr:PIN domain-containing protein [Sedimentisphaerales bacterium]